jgi:hypothetical protein
MLIPQDKANHFVWTTVILTAIFGIVVGINHVLNLNINFFIMVSFSFIAAALIGVVKEIRDYVTGKGTPSFLDIMANLCALFTIFCLITFVVISCR